MDLHNKFTTLCLLLSTALCSRTHAQSIADLQTKYQGEPVVMLNHSLAYQISVAGGQPQVRKEEHEQLLYLASEARSFYSRYFFYHGSFDSILQYAAYTRTAEGKKIKVTDFKTAHSESNGIFYDDVKETSFDFPGVSSGAIGTLDVTSIEKDPHLLSPFYFSRGIPMANAQLTVTFPKTMSIKYVLKGADSGRIVFRRDERHGEVTYIFQAKDQAAEKAYEDAPAAAWYRPHVVFYIENYQDEAGRSVSYLANPGDLYRLDRAFVTDINRSTGTSLKAIVDSICHGVNTPYAKAKRIYGWVQQNIRYIAFEQGMEGFVPRDANLVCSRRFGDCKDMASILTTMLKAAGLQAYYTWIGTRKLPYTYTETPLPIVDNHMISTLLLDGQYIFLDATDPDCIFGIPTDGIQGKQAMIGIDDTAFKLLNVPVVSKENNRITDSTVLDLTDKGLTGHINMEMTGYYAMGFQGFLSWQKESDKDEQIKHKLFRGSNKFRLDSYQVGDRSEKSHIGLTGAFSLQDYAKHIGKDWYVNMNLFKFYEHQEIDYPKRKMPIEFDFCNQRRYVVVLNIPPGYHVSYMPAGKTYHNAVWGFSMSYENKGNKLIFTQEFDNDHLLLTADQFADWNKVLENLFPLYKETVSLTAN